LWIPVSRATGKHLRHGLKPGLPRALGTARFTTPCASARYRWRRQSGGGIYTNGSSARHLEMASLEPAARQSRRLSAGSRADRSDPTFSPATGVDSGWAALDTRLGIQLFRFALTVWTITQGS